MAPLATLMTASTSASSNCLGGGKGGGGAPLLNDISASDDMILLFCPANDNQRGATWKILGGLLAGVCQTFLSTMSSGGGQKGDRQMQKHSF
jgi:hypothetical protein